MKKVNDLNVGQTYTIFKDSKRPDIFMKLEDESICLSSANPRSVGVRNAHNEGNDYPAYNVDVYRVCMPV